MGSDASCRGSGVRTSGDESNESIKNCRRADLIAIRLVTALRSSIGSFVKGGVMADDFDGEKLARVKLDPGRTEWPIPAGVTAVIVEGVGGGGGGEDGDGDAQAGYGGCGCLASVLTLSVTGATIPYVIGKGGEHGSDGTPSVFGGQDSTFGKSAVFDGAPGGLKHYAAGSVPNGFTPGGSNVITTAADELTRAGSPGGRSPEFPGVDPASSYDRGRPGGGGGSSTYGQGGGGGGGGGATGDQPRSGNDAAADAYGAGGGGGGALIASGVQSGGKGAQGAIFVTGIQRITF